MALTNRVVAAAERFLAKHPESNSDQLRTHLCEEFAVHRDSQLVALRSGLWPVAALITLWRLFVGRHDQQLHQMIEEVVQEFERCKPRLPP